jgi:hypothetical protein
MEHHASPQSFHVCLGSRAVLPQCIDDFEIASHLVVFRPEHTHGRQERNPHGAFPVKAADKQKWPSGNLQQFTEGTAIPASAASERATAFPGDCVLYSSSLRGNLAIARRPFLSLTEAFGRAPAQGRASTRLLFLSRH